jgi:hypothetical protein
VTNKQMELPSDRRSLANGPIWIADAMKGDTKLVAISVMMKKVASRHCAHNPSMAYTGIR